jgi:PAS domain S-box-containing protein
MNKPVAGSLEGSVPGPLAAPKSPGGPDESSEKWRRHALVVADERGRVVEWNEAATLVFGYEREEVLGRQLSQLILPPARRDEATRCLRELSDSAGGRVVSTPIEWVATRSSGEEIPVRARVTRTATAPPNYVFSICDLSGNEPTELSRRQLEAILAGSEDAIGTVTLDGTVLARNAAGEEIYGFSAAEAIGAKVADLTVPRELRGELLHWERRLARGETIETENRRRRREGSEVVDYLRVLNVRAEG